MSNPFCRDVGDILVAYDGSEGSRKALKKAESMLKEGDQLVAVYVLPTKAIEGFAYFDYELTREKAQGALNEVIEELKSRNVDAIGLLREGDVAEEIIEIAGETQCDMIVIGSKGLSKVGTFSLGSVAEKVARHANRMVLIVR
ncbi:MAG: universal stress protein [Thermoplasmata archaeon]